MIGWEIAVPHVRLENPPFLDRFTMSVESISLVFTVLPVLTAIPYEILLGVRVSRLYAADGLSIG